MKTTTVLLAMAFLAISTALAATPGPSPTPTPSTASTVPTVTPTPLPEATIKLSNGQSYTVTQIEQAVRSLSDRVAELTAQRNAYLGQLADATLQIQKLQPQTSAATPSQPVVTVAPPKP